MGGLYTVAGIERFGAEVGRDKLTGIIGIMTALSSSLFAFLIGKVCERIGKQWASLSLPPSI